ncbi:alpha/beta hydrolase family protein [Leucobacter soli]|uniref:Acetyl esterase n=1 Tax=Leucobacter soli TaxID=2812850 RepID=A0A916JWZ8_9MICO|nr:alpha/beta hydrolase [Leucobacter soli]CAG7611941.1 Acetyl esterase [Leucobacter soli]
MTDAVRSQRGITYRSVDGIDLELDLHVPTGAEAPPLAIYFHGGGFEVGTRSDYEETRALALAARGIAVATVGYRLAAAAPFPAPLEDARAAAAWLRAHGAEYGVATERIGSVGASAGGYLAAMLALEVDGAPPVVDAAVPWFGPLDLAFMTGGTPLELELFDPAESFLGAAYDPRRPEHVGLNPIANVTRGASPFLLLTGDRDRVIDAAVSERFHTALTLAGVPSTLVTVGGAGHEDPAIDAPEYADLIAGFLRSRLGGAA